MDAAKIKAALADISAEKDPTQKALKMSSLCSAIFREKGVDLVLVGGSAIEAYTEGAYTSGDIDLCISNGVSLDLRSRQELMSPLKPEGGPRSWRVAGLFVEILGALETFARTPRLMGPLNCCRRKNCWWNGYWWPFIRNRIPRHVKPRAN